MQTTERKIYWEKQGQDKLCGVNCLNSLLQGPYYNEIELSNIALELDQQENLLFGKEKTNQISQNVALDGNFSIQVLAAALEKMGLIHQSVDAKIYQNHDLRINKQNNESSEMGFICNSSSHWFPIRKIEDTWYNLNSTNRGGPEIVSDFYLSAFLQSIKEGGYTIFVVKGDFPKPENVQELFDHYNPNQRWFTKQQVRAVHEKRMKKKNYKLNIGGSDERDYEEAIKRSLGKQGNNKAEEEDDEDDWNQVEHPDILQPKNEQKQGTQAFQGQGVQISNQENQIVNYSKFEMNQQDDPELGYAIKLSLESQFQNQFENGINIAFALPNGKQKIWSFSQDALVEDLYDFVLYSLDDGDIFKYLLSTSYPSVALNNVNLSLAQVGIDDMTQIYVTKL